MSKIKEFVSIKLRSEYLEQVMNVLVNVDYPIYFKNTIKSLESPRKIITMVELFEKGLKDETMIKRMSEKSIYWLEVLNTFFENEEYKFFFDKEENLELVLNFDDHNLLYDFLSILERTANIETIKEYYDICQKCTIS